MNTIKCKEDKKMKFKPLFLSVALMSLLSFAVGCGSGGGGSASSDGSGSGSGGGSGTLSLLLQDAFSESYAAVYVTIKEVQVHLRNDENDDRNWRVVASPNKTYNLLELRNGVRERLGITDLEAGSYTQMRLIIGSTPDNGINLLSRPHPAANYVITKPDNEIHELKIPSGFQTGIKIVHGFVIEANKTTELILDFDASKSVVRAGHSGRWLLKPTIKVLETREYSIVSGTVSANSGGSSIVIAPSPSPLPGALVSAQQVSEDNPEVIASTTSDKDGKYALFIHPGEYYIVGSKIGPEIDTGTGYKLGYDPVCIKIITEAGETYPNRDLELGERKTTGKVEGTVSIFEGEPDQSVTLSFRKSVLCRDASEEKVIEVKPLNVGDGATYSEELTPGFYTLHASTAGHEAFKSEEFEVKQGEKIELNFTL
jgi:hypothetical protein